MLLTVILNVFC